MRPVRTLALAFTVAAALFAAPPAAAQMQIPDHFENLQVLPKDIPKDTLVAVMRSFAGSLGVRCNFCHVEREAAGGPPSFNFASDDRANKRNARVMMRMVRTINTQQLTQLPERNTPPVNVTCLTCHRGLPVPTTLGRVLTAALDSGGAQAAVARYRQLRERDLASGRYDFSESSLTDLARTLAAQGKTAEAATLLELNAEFYPQSGQVEFQLGEVYRMRGERDKALVHYRMAQAKDPNNPQVARRIQELSGAAPAPAPNAPPAPPRPRR
ncbi:MAG TPA: c-type cytochrome [Longimicrobium sp.]|nr:c-type cytochrome [Longimicrobium sp.]